MNTLDEISFVVLSQESYEVEQMMYQLVNSSSTGLYTISIGLIPLFSSIADGWLSILESKDIETEISGTKIPFDKLVKSTRVGYKLFSDKKINRITKQVQSNCNNFLSLLKSDYNFLQKIYIKCFGQQDFGVYHLNTIPFGNTSQFNIYLDSILDISTNNTFKSLENKGMSLLGEYSENLASFISSTTNSFGFSLNKELKTYVQQNQFTNTDFFFFDNKRKNILGGKLPTSTQLFLFNIYCQNNLFNYAIPYIFHSHNKLYYRSKIQSYLISINVLKKVQKKCQDLLKSEYIEEINYLIHKKELYFTFENKLRNNIFHYQIENTPISAFSDKNRFFEEMIEYHTVMKFDKFIEKIDNYLIQINSLICSIIEYDTK
ncbi:hypothetical protein [Pseudolactococcus raffinolactis]|uniref:hypothetical protein n=1 Tax=Pseudolactococcus raffinolactis TaxID=1366 RepID=UPI00077C0C7F|nr:hypothetical protein [Lactococcus raffinolactis]PCS09487.1 hypothetical protein RU88_GL001470 [Lactococcus raffinolactis]HBZ59842.1 hypothetical protein [Lactococcus sp.]